MSRPTTPLPANPLDRETFVSPTRSTTAPIKSKHHHHISHHPHRSHHRHRSDKNIPQSAVAPPSSHPFGDFLAKSTSRLDGGGTHTPPRQAAEAEEEKVKEGERRRELDRIEEGRKWKIVERMKARREEGDDELRQTLSSLSTLSTNTTRRLDYAYYNLLSSLSSLSSSISQLHALCNSTCGLANHFECESTSLSSDILASISTARQGFERQRRRIESLEGRMMGGRKNVEELGERLHAVRAKIEACDQRDGEKRRRVGRRLRMLGGSLTCLLVFVLAVVVLKQTPTTQEKNTGMPFKLDSGTIGNMTERLNSTREYSETVGLAAQWNDTSLRDGVEGLMGRLEAGVTENPTTKNDSKSLGSDRVLDLLENL